MDMDVWCRIRSEGRTPEHARQRKPGESESASRSLLWVLEIRPASQLRGASGRSAHSVVPVPMRHVPVAVLHVQLPPWVN